MTRIALLVLGLSSCGSWMTDGDFYYLQRAGAELPVLVRGNIDSGVFLVTIHGGPGHTGLGLGLSPGLQALEQDMAVVYWDQRASGSSQGNPSSDTYTVADFVADTDGVLALVEEVYEVDALFVYGHSWGGDLALATMVEGQRTDSVDAWIVSGGAHNEAFALAESRAWVIDAAEGYIAEGTNTEFWTDALQWYRDNPDALPSNDVHYVYVNAASGYYLDPSTYEDPPMLELAFGSPFSMGYFQNVERSQVLCKALLDGFDVSAGLPLFTAPVLVMGGEHDGVVPSSVAEEIHALLGTAPEDKHLSILPGVAHTPRDEDPEAFADLVSAFIEEYTP